MLKSISPIAAGWLRRSLPLGVIALVSVVSPYAEARQVARELHERDGLRFVEVFVNTPLDECVRRDPKGLYARAKAGNLKGFTGVDDPYEAPSDPDVELRCEPLEEAVARVLEALDGLRDLSA